jgi:cyclase
VSGTAAFADCLIISNKRTADHLKKHKVAIENGTSSGPPAINPLIMPTQTFEGSMHLHIGGLHIDLIEANIHSDDATVLWLGSERILLAGGTMEDTVTYVGEPENFDIHLKDLDRLWVLNPERILPNHGDPEIIALVGYEKP